MGEIAVVGAHPMVAGFALAGAQVCPTDGPDDVRAAWHTLPATVAVVVLTPDAAEALRDVAVPGAGPLTVVLPL